MTSKESKRRRTYTPQEMEVRVAEVRGGRSVREVAKECGMPATTLQDWVTGKYTHGPHTNLAITPEEELIQYALWMADHGWPLSRATIKVYALEMVKASGRASLVNLE